MNDEELRSKLVGDGGAVNEEKQKVKESQVLSVPLQKQKKITSRMIKNE
jgi:hypothetical protein